MNIKDLLTCGANVSLTVSLADLKEFALEVYGEAQRRGEAAGKQKRADKKLTAKELMEQYHIGQTALWRWEKKGYLVPSRLGNRRYYSRNAVEEMLGGC